MTVPHIQIKCNGEGKQEAFYLIPHEARIWHKVGLMWGALQEACILQSGVKNSLDFHSGTQANKPSPYPF